MQCNGVSISMTVNAPTIGFTAGPDPAFVGVLEEQMELNGRWGRRG